MLKNKIRKLLQRILGFNNYLFIFSVFTIRRLYMSRHEQEFLYFLSLLPTDKLLLDIGANIGIMTVPLAQKAVNGQVFSFEPVPQNIKALKRVVKFYKLSNVSIFECALGNVPGELKMLLPVVDKVKMQGFSRVIETYNPEEGELYIVPVQKLDDIPELQDAKAIAGIKIDVENFEYEVFKGAENLLRKHKPIIYCELWDNEKRKITLDYLTNEIGYHVKIYDGRELVPYTNQNIINFFMIP